MDSNCLLGFLSGFVWVFYFLVIYLYLFTLQVSMRCTVAKSGNQVWLNVYD